MLDVLESETMLLRARRVAAMLPGQAVIPDGAVLVRQGRVAAVGSWKALKSASAPVRDLGETTLTPGLINAHTHLELSHVGLPPFRGQGFTAWVSWLLAQPLGEVTAEALARAAGQLAGCGTAAVGDISGRHPGRVARAMAAAGIICLTQFEWFGFQERGEWPSAPSIPQVHENPDKPEGGGASLAADVSALAELSGTPGLAAELSEVAEDRLAMAGHALYSTHPETLRQAKAWDRARGRCFSLHLAEHAGEVELLAQGTGDFAELLRRRVLPESYVAPGLSPVALARNLGLLDERTLAVHCVHVSKTDIALLQNSGATVCLCPRSNALIGVGRAPAGALLEAGIPCCLGTDSLASVEDLDLWSELRALLSGLDRSLGLTAALALVTENPARVLGLCGLGSLAPGASARFSLLPPDLEAALDD